MACPYFVPEKRCESELWMHRARLPLGDGYEGRCSAPGYEASKPTEDELKSGCNLGNARCKRLPAERDADAVRFHVGNDHGETIDVSYCTERDHHPSEHGVLQFDVRSSTFVAAAARPAIISLAGAFVKSHMERHPRATGASN